MKRFKVGLELDCLCRENNLLSGNLVLISAFGLIQLGSHSLIIEQFRIDPKLSKGFKWTFKLITGFIHDMTLFIYIYNIDWTVWLAVRIGLYVRIDIVDMFDLFDSMYLE